MPAEHTVADEPKALRLARYLREFVRLRRTTVRNVEMYEEVLWFGDVPQEKECRSPAWSDEFEAGDSWLSVEKQQFPKPPLPPDTILPWVDQGALTRAAEEMPPLNPTILVPDSEAEVGDGEEPPLREESLKQHPEVTEAYERYRPTWLAWAEEHFRRERIQKVYARLFNLHTQLRKQGELVELVLGLGLLDWHRSDHPWVRRHVVAARADLLFDPKTGMIRVEAPPDGARPHIEDEMLEPGVRPDRHLYDAMGEQLSEIGDDLWDHPRIVEALRFWGHAVHSDSQWSQTLSPSPTNDDKPLLTFAPALILRRRNEAGMARIYDRMIGQLGGEGGEPPPGWTALVEYLSDSDDSGPRAAGAEFN
jgi:hypothetical protein